MYLSIFICPYVVSKFLSACTSTHIKKKQILINYFLHQPLDGWFDFFSESKFRCGDSLQTSSLVFLVNFSGILQLKNTKVGLSGSKEMCISLFKKWTWIMFTPTKMKCSAWCLVFKSSTTWTCYLLLYTPIKYLLIFESCILNFAEEL